MKKISNYSKFLNWISKLDDHYHAAWRTYRKELRKNKRKTQNKKTKKQKKQTKKTSKQKTANDKFIHFQAIFSIHASPSRKQLSAKWTYA